MTTLEYINDLERKIKNSINFLHSGRENFGMKIVREIPEGLELILEFKQYVENFLKNKNILNIERIQEILLKINDAIDNLDYIYLGDLLENELLIEIDLFACELYKIKDENN